MRIKRFFAAPFLLFLACNQGPSIAELPNTKLLSVISFTDTVEIESSDFFDFGIADRLTSKNGVTIERLDSSRFRVSGEAFLMRC